MAPSGKFESKNIDKSKTKHSNKQANPRLLTGKTDLDKGKFIILVKSVLQPRFPFKNMVGHGQTW